MKVEDINTVYINAVSTSEEVKVILDHTTDIKNIKELLGILNNARPYSGAAPADRYGEFTFSMKDGSENSLEFNGHGLFFVVNASQSYILEPESDVKLLNTFIDGLKNLLHTKNQF